jgi:hypothetical protein
MSEQTSDSAQKGPGLKPPSVPSDGERAPSPQTGPNGSSQGSSRGKDGKS